MRDVRPRRESARAALLAAWLAAVLAAGCGDDVVAPAPAPEPPVAPIPPLMQADPTVHVRTVAADEAVLGVPLYPRATIEGEGASQVATDGGTTLLLSQRSPDPAREVAFFYREAMRVLAGGKELAEIGGADDGSTTLVLGDPAARRAVQVRVSAEGTGSRIQIVSTLAASP